MKIPKIKDFMDKSLITLKPDLNVYDALGVLLKKKRTSAAVVDDQGKLIGVFSEKDCLHSVLHGLYEGLPGKSVCDHMTQDVYTITPETDVLALIDTFRQHPYRRLLVVEDGKLIGQVTRWYLLKIIYELKEGKTYNRITGRYQALDAKSVIAAKMVNK